MKPVDYRAVAAQVYDFAASQSPLAPLVREALGVIDDAIECFGYVLLCYALQASENNEINSPSARTMSPSASMAERTVSQCLSVLRREDLPLPLVIPLL